MAKRITMEMAFAGVQGADIVATSQLQFYLLILIILISLSQEICKLMLIM